MPVQLELRALWWWKEPSFEIIVHDPFKKYSLLPELPEFYYDHQFKGWVGYIPYPKFADTIKTLAKAGVDLESVFFHGVYHDEESYPSAERFIISLLKAVGGKNEARKICV